jgi:HupE / UreJ protein
LAFATTIAELGLGRWERVASILAFNLGIETMQLIVVASIMPSLLLMSCTRAYPFLRIGGALFAGLASLGWITERLAGVHNSMDLVVNTVAHHGAWITVGLFLMSVVCWSLPKILVQPSARSKYARKPFLSVPALVVSQSIGKHGPAEK